MSTESTRNELLVDLIGVLQTQARQLEQLVTHVEQACGRMPESHQFSVIAGELAELKVRMKKLAEAGR